MKRTEPLRVDAIIRQAMDQCGATHTFRQQQICFLWAEIVRPSITRCTIRRWVDHDVLHVHLNSASLKHELAFAAPRLVERLNRAVGSDVISKIVFH